MRPAATSIRAFAPLPTWLAVVLAVASGPVLDAAFPDRGWWPFAFAGVGMVLVALIGAGTSRALVVGFASGLSFYLVHIEWATTFLGPVPWAALSTAMALYGALGAVPIALAYRFVPRVWPSAPARMLLLPAIVAGAWTAREAVASVWPYGGFAWGRVALSQSESPLAGLFAWLGISGVSFVCVFLVAMAIEAVREFRVPALMRASAVVAAAAMLITWPAWPVDNAGRLTVAAVQGNAKAGYFQYSEPGENLMDQVAATEPLYGEQVDVVIWPEGASDLDPLRSNIAARVFDQVSRRMDAPLIAGTITQRDDEVFNTSLLWQAGEGVVDYYDKKHPVPFGEYVPNREFWSLFAPDLIGLIQRDYTPGTRDAVFDVGEATVSVNICFDIVDDRLIRGSVHDGAQAIFAQTNNADFGRSDETVQQLAIARIRAIETGRTVVNISTVGVSAVILPDGEIADQLEWYRPGAMLQPIPLSDTVTPAVAAGDWIEALVSGFGLAGALIPAFVFRRRRRG